jgi:hypothetical protein
MKEALGCTVCCGDFTRASRRARRTPRWPSGTARMARRGGRRRDAAAALRRGWHGDAVHDGASRRHLGDPYLTAKLRSCTKATERRRRLRSGTAAALQRTAAKRRPRDWVAGVALGFRGSRGGVGRSRWGAPTRVLRPHARGGRLGVGSGPRPTLTRGQG